MFLALTPVVLLLLARPVPRLFWSGLPFIVAGSAIRIWSAGCLRKLNSLTTDGPFAMCRNPLYIGSFLIAVGYFAVCGRVEVWVAGTVLFWLFHGGAIAYEEKLLRDRYGESFADYCRRTPRLVPRLRRLRDSAAIAGAGQSEDSAQDMGFSLDQVFYNNEPRSVLGTLVFAAVFGIISHFPDLAPARWLFG